MSKIGNQWATFVEKVISEEASTEQIEESKKCFYAGAVSVLYAMREMTALDTKDAVQGLYDMEEEGHNFLSKLIAENSKKI